MFRLKKFKPIVQAFLLIGMISLAACHSGGDHKHNADKHQHKHGHKDNGGKEHKHGHKAEDGHHHDANHHMNQSNFDDLVERFEGKERDAYQKPDEVINLLGNMEGKTIMDIGSGTGYFSFRLVAAGAKVIAADVDERFLKYIEEKRSTENISDEQLSLRKVPYASSLLEPEEVDQVIIVNTYHHIENRKPYFEEVLKGLKGNGPLVVVDFFKRETTHGPPVEHKVSKEKVIEELRASGFQRFEVQTELLEDQYIISAFKK